MVIYEDYGQNGLGLDLTRAYSDEGYYIERDGHLYSEAVDLTEQHRQYTETNIKPEDEITDETEAYAEAGRILMGVDNE